jgi:hypothetical protein
MGPLQHQSPNPRNQQHRHIHNKQRITLIYWKLASFLPAATWHHMAA